MSIPSTFRYRANGGLPWHGTGVALPDGLTPSQAILADPLLGSTVSVRPLQYPGSDGRMRDAPDSVCIVVRDHDNAAIGRRSVSSDYAPAQPRDKCALLDRIAAEFGAQFDVAGLLKGGAVWWAQAQFGEPIRLAGDDTVHARFTVFDSFDGSMPLAAGLASTRAVCSNTIGHALTEAKGARYYRPIRHTGDVAAKLASAGDAFAAAVTGWQAFREFAERAQAPIAKAVAATILEQLIPLPEGDANPARAKAKRDEIWAAFGAGIGNRGRTGWDLYNGVTQWATWQSPVKGDNAQASRWQSALLGDGADLAAQAQQLITATW